MNRRTVLSSAWASCVGLIALEALPSTGWAALFSQADASSALRAALERGAQVAVRQLGATDGFLANDKVRIGLPDVLEKAAPILRTVGRGAQLDELVTAMNHGAESAVALAQPLLVQAIKGMTVQDAQRIIQGGDNAVTDYFTSRTRTPLGQKFLPVVSKTLDKLTITRQYNDLAGKASKLGLVQGDMVTVQDHVTQKALDALYFVIGEEERRIRKDPVGTGSALLKKVFGAL
ncbi:MAG TPA: DUF4197 domain-containing protein [Aquabacterium sp.]|uniref:DUF4197 domain-containing protein n=1 Tax=Aquabacterium sp. TaxID=1872578 RepID=UPI002E3395B1|nr:DUF4197 domain-containing protein [Aquabacterium sp.]HEX5355210.1 DUF4197 domain-containing protein [Aquabacterium sp.]